jgi:3-hydroxymyristoyl/3-hydroxydecanoyl-(acyl carrier protein) dehydratase
MPGVLQIEAMAQAIGVLILSRPENAGRLAYFMSISNAKFRRAVLPGDQLRIDVAIIKARGVMARVRGRITVGDDVASEAELMFTLVER